jgi:hypothetical protein
LRRQVDFVAARWLDIVPVTPPFAKSARSATGKDRAETSSQLLY